MRRLSEIGGRRMPLLRWSALRMLFGTKHLTTHWQVGDGREAALASYVTANARDGDLDDAIRVIDEFCYQQSIMMNVGDEKGAILDAAIRRAEPRRLLELGTYCGYSALRTARVMPDGARLYSIEFLPANAEIARRILAHAGVGDRVTVIVGTLGDGGATITALEEEHGSPASRSTSSSSITTRTRTCRTSNASSRVDGCAPARWPWPTTSSSRARPPTASTCANAKAASGARSSTRRTSSTRRC
jgi:O-methyltransferase